MITCAYLPLLKLRLHFLTTFRGKIASVSQCISMHVTISKGSVDTRLNTQLLVLKDSSYISMPGSVFRLKTNIAPIDDLIAYLLSILSLVLPNCNKLEHRRQ